MANTYDFHLPPDLIVGPEADFLPMAGKANWGMAAFQVAALREVTRGRGQITGIVDTGIWGQHPELTNCVAARDFTGSRNGSLDMQGHGTHVSGTIGSTNESIGVAPEATLVHGKGLGDSGSGTGSWIANAMQWCADQGAEIISMSLGSSGEDPTITAMIQKLADSGIWVICAAGNSGGSTPNTDWPGRSPYAINVAALAENMQVASFSSAGAKIDTSGPGTNIWSCKTGGGYRQMSGTSMATPFISGVLTLLRAAYKIKGRDIPKVDDLRKLIEFKSVDVGGDGDDRRTGPGWLSPLLLDLGVELPPPITAQE